MNARLALYAGLGTLALGAACVAPMCRTSAIEPGLTLSTELGGTLFRSTGIVKDTSSWWGGHTVPLTCVGAQADLRATCGFKTWLGADLSAGFNVGSIVHRPESLKTAWTGSWRLAAAALFRPWPHNSLMFVEYQLPHLFCLGWVSGFPLHGREQWSVMAQLGVIPFYVATHDLDVGWRDFVPDFFELAVRRNFTLKQGAIAPALGGTVAWNWDTFVPTLTNATLGLIWSPPPFSRTGQPLGGR